MSSKKKTGGAEKKAGKKADSRFAFPFPGRELAEKELSYDPCYEKIAPEDREKIVDKAWKKGEAAARQVFQEEDGSYDFFAICEKSGLKVQEKNIDYVVGKQRYFSDYISGKNLVHLYTKSVQLWAEQNHLELKEAENLILSHEYYHYLEMNRIGLTSREYQVPMVIIGNLKIGKTGIRALSEIGAHAFARTYAQMIRERKTDD